MLRIGRSKAYEFAREYLATDGASGMPVIRLGKQLRVPRALLERWMGGPITWPIANRRPAASPVVSIASTTRRSRPRSTYRVDVPTDLDPVLRVGVMTEFHRPPPHGLLRIDECTDTRLKGVG